MTPVVFKAPVRPNTPSTAACWSLAGYNTDPAVPSWFDLKSFSPVAFGEVLAHDDLVLGSWDDGTFDWVIAKSVFPFGAAPIWIGSLQVLRDVCRMNVLPGQWWAVPSGSIMCPSPITKGLGSKTNLSISIPSSGPIGATGPTGTNCGPQSLGPQGLPGSTAKPVVAPAIKVNSPVHEQAWRAAGYAAFCSLNAGFNSSFVPLPIGHRVDGDDFIFSLNRKNLMEWAEYRHSSYSTMSNNGEVLILRHYDPQVGSQPRYASNMPPGFFNVSTGKVQAFASASPQPGITGPVVTISPAAFANANRDVFHRDFAQSSSPSAQLLDWACRSPACSSRNTTSPAGFPCWRCGSKQ